MQTATLFNIADYECVRYKLKRKITMTLKDGTTGRDLPVTDITQKRRPAPAVTPTPAYQNRQPDHSTLPPIRITAATKRLISEGDYDEALCVKAFHHWNHQFKRWEAILEFVFNPPVPAGPPIPMHVRMGSEAEPELKADHWLAQLINRFGGDVSKLSGWRFRVSVETIKRRQGDKVDRQQAEWYSRVKRAVLWDDYVLSSSRGRF